MRWDLIRKQTSKAVELPIEIYPTDMDWFPINASSSNKQTSDLILLAAADGIYFFLRGEGGKMSPKFIFTWETNYLLLFDVEKMNCVLNAKVALEGIIY